MSKATQVFKNRIKLNKLYDSTTTLDPQELIHGVKSGDHENFFDVL